MVLTILCMQTDHLSYWDNVVDGVRKAREHNRDIKVAVEYKIKEPRTHIQTGTSRYK